MATAGPFYDTMPGPERRDKFNEMWSLFEDAIANARGPQGWAPVLGLAADGQRVVFRIVDWIAGEGEKPTISGYIGATGIVATAAEAIDVRGAAGADGDITPELEALRDDVQALAIQIAADAQQASEAAVTAATAAQASADSAAQTAQDRTAVELVAVTVASDASQAQAAAGSAALASDDAATARNAAQAAATQATQDREAVGQDRSAVESAAQGVATAAGQVSSDREATEQARDAALAHGNGWTAIEAVVADGERRVIQIVDWTAGVGPKPVTGVYVGPTGFVTGIGDATDIRGSGAGSVASVNGQLPDGAGDVSVDAGQINATLADEASSPALPALGVSTVNALLQTARNALRWLVMRFNASGRLSVEYGGTGAGTAADARAALGAGTSNFSGAYADLSGLPALFSGAYSDLTGKPQLGTAAALDVPAQAASQASAAQVARGDDPRLAAVANKVDSVAGKGLSSNDYTTAEQTKLAGVGYNATANSSDGFLLDRGNHTGTQPMASVTGLPDALDAKAAILQPVLEAERTKAMAIAAASIDVSASSYHYQNVTTPRIFSFSGVPAANSAQFVVVELYLASSYSVTFLNVLWGGSAPTLVAGKINILVFYHCPGNPNNGSYWRGFLASSGH